MILSWARSPVAPHGGALQALSPHALAAPVVQAVLQRAGVAPSRVDAVVVGNALGAGGNPARMVALAAGLPQRCAALSVDTQCCSGLDAVSVACGLLASGQASVVLAGGVEAWSRAPLRLHRPLTPDQPPLPYERPAFAPDPQQDPDLLEAAARYAAQQGITRLAQDDYARSSHQRAVQQRGVLADEIVPVAGVLTDTYPRLLDARRAARMPALYSLNAERDCSVSALGISARADGAAFVLLASPQACARLQLQARLRWRMAVLLGADPQSPLLAAELAAQECLARASVGSAALDVIEMHDAFAVQGLQFCQALQLDPLRVNRCGGGLARGHPIGASAAIALVRMLSDLARLPGSGGLGLTAVAGAGGVGAAALVERL